MRKSFTRLLSLVMLLGLFQLSAVANPFADQIDPESVWPTDEGGEAYSKTTDKLMIIYDEDVMASSGSIRLETATGDLVQVIPATDSRVSYAKGDTVVIDFSADLEELTTYNVIVDEGAFKTVADETASAKIGAEAVVTLLKSASAIDEWMFTTGDYTAPELDAVVPEEGDVVDDNTIDLVLTFTDDSDIEEGAGTITVYKADGNVWDLVVLDFGVGGNAELVGGDLTVSGIRQLEDTEMYAVTISAGVVVDEGKTADGTKNEYEGLSDRTVWTFSTEDFTAPMWASGYPEEDNVSNDSFDVLVDLKEDGTVYGLALLATAPTPSLAAIRAGEEVDVTAGTEAKLSFDGLAEETEYTVYLVADNDDVEGDEIEEVDVTTGETVDPVLEEVQYVDDVDATVTGNVVDPKTGIDLDLDEIVLVFDEDIELGAGGIEIWRVEEGTEFMTIASGDMEVDDNELSFPISGLENGVAYYATIPNTLVFDEFGNNYGGISDVTGWRFTASDDIAPTYEITPAHASMDVDEDVKVVLTFDEPVTPAATWADEVYIEDADGGAIAFSVAVDENDGKFTEVTLTPDADLPSGELVRVVIEEADIADASSNAVSDEAFYQIAFKVVDHEGPVIDEWDPGATLSSADETIKIKYNEGIQLTADVELTADNLYTILTVKEDDENGSNVDATFAISDDKKVISIMPVDGWDSEAKYYVSVSSAVEDLSGNAYDDADPADRENTYTVSDLVAETVVIEGDGSDIDGEIVATDVVLTVFFDDDARSKVFVGGWQTYALALMDQIIVLKENDANGADVPFTVATADATTFTITATLEGDMDYYISVGPATQDGNGNINVPNSATFSTLYEGIPKLESIVPDDEDVEVDEDADIVLTFNTDIEIDGGGTDITVEVDGGGAVAVPVTNADIDDNVLTIDPADFGKNATVEVVIPDDLILNVDDATGLLHYGGKTITFETEDDEFLTIALNNDGDTDVELDDELEITFGEDAMLGSGNVDIRNFDTGASVELINVNSDQVEIDDEVVTITPSMMFDYATKYYVEVDGGAFVDKYGNPSAEIVGKTDVGLTDWVFTTADPDLEITDVTPADGSDKIAVDAPIVVEFNRDIKFGAAGSVGFLVQEGSTFTPETYTIDSENLSIDGNTLTILHPNNDYPEDVYVWLYLEADAVVPATGSADGNIAVDQTTAPNTWSWFTGNDNPPVPTFDPEDFDDEYTAVDANITITFDEDIFHEADGTVFTAGDITDDDIFQLFNDDTDEEISFVGAISGRVVTLNPDVDLDEYQMYRIQINDGVDGVADADGIVTPTTTSKFMTTDNTAPTVTVDDIVDGDEMFTFDATVDDINAKKFYYLVRVKSADADPTAETIMADGESEDADDGVTIDDIEVDGLAPSTTYEIFYVAIDDFDNVSAVGSKEAETLDTVDPMLVSTDPATGSVDVEIDSDEIVVELTFDEDVVVGTGAIVVREVNTNTILATLDETALSADDEVVELTIPFTADMDAVEMYIEMAEGTVEVEAGNEFAGIFGDAAIYLTTQDYEIPTVNDWSNDITSTENIEVEFTEDVVAGDGNAVLYLGTALNTEDAVEVFDADDIVIDGAVATFDPMAALDVGVDYTLVLSADFVRDAAGNKYDDEDELLISVDENEVPFIETVVPAGAGPHHKSTLGSLDFVFNEAVYYMVDGIETSILFLTEAQIMDFGLVSLEDKDGNAVDFTIVLESIDGIELVVDTDDLDHNNEYTVKIMGFFDEDGAVMEDEEIAFETTDGIVPTAVFDPEDDTEDVMEDAILTITFNEQIYRSVSDPIDETDEFFYEPFTNDNVHSVVFLREKGGDDVAFTATFDGVSVITITPDDPLESGMTYEFGYDGDIVDEDDQDADGDPDLAEFTVRDYEIPTFELADVTPAMGESMVVADADMEIMWSEDVVVGPGSVIIRNLDGTYSETISGDGLSIDDGDVLVIEHANFPPDMDFFVELTDSVVLDKSGNPSEAYVDDEFGWTFTTKDTYAMTATVTPLGDNQPNIVDLQMTFNKDVLAGPASDFDYYLAVYKEDGTAVKQIDVDELVVLNNTVTYYGLVLEQNQGYYVRVEPDAFQDASGNTFGGIMDDSWTFSTMDNIAPMLVSTDPIDNSTAVNPATSFMMTFDREIAAGAGTIDVRYFADGALFESVDVSAASIDSTTLTFNLSTMLDANTEFYVLVPEGAVTNTEATMDPFAGILNTYDWDFTTGDVVIVPELASMTPQDTIADNHPVFEMTFADNVMMGEMGYLTVTEKDSADAFLMIEITADMIVDNVVTVPYTYDTVQGGLNINTTYIVNVDNGVLVNEFGNAWKGISDDSWMFTTGDDFATNVEKPVATAEFKVYPNPFNDIIYIDNNDKLTRVVISNIAGQRVIDVAYPDREIRTGGLVSGMYFVSMFTESGIAKTSKIIKK